jgi:hypothetical protein
VLAEGTVQPSLVLCHLRFRRVRTGSAEGGSPRQGRRPAEHSVVRPARFTLSSSSYVRLLGRTSYGSDNRCRAGGSRRSQVHRGSQVHRRRLVRRRKHVRRRRSDVEDNGHLCHAPDRADRCVMETVGGSAVLHQRGKSQCQVRTSSEARDLPWRDAGRPVMNSTMHRWHR